jgi:uncharacterized membrane protein SpoIIM required for sporulation
MLFPGEILSQNKWVVLFAIITVVMGITFGANRSAYENFLKTAPTIEWKNVPQSALTLFISNFASALSSFFMFPLLLLIFFRFIIVPGGISLGISIGISLWLISQSSSAIMVFSHGILEIYSAFLAAVGGWLLIMKIGEAVLGFIKPTPHYVDWNKVTKELGYLFLFSTVGLFISAWLEAFLGYAIRFGPSAELIAIANTCISVLTVSILSFKTVRMLLTGKTKLTVLLGQEPRREGVEAEKLPYNAWCVCPKCGTYISVDVDHCPSCGTDLPRKIEMNLQLQRPKKQVIGDEQPKPKTSRELPAPYWCVCPKCGTWIGLDIDHCPVCGASLPGKKN